MTKIVEKLKKKPNLIKAVILSLVPLLAGVLLCALDGRTILDIYLPVSDWNDELMYYKQVEAVVEYGIPQGFFGYDESRAMHLSFGTWNPLLLLPYVVWGLLFGWNLMSPILCNIVLMMVAVFCFVLLTKPGKKQGAFLAILYTAALFITRYCLSAMAESILIFYAVLYLGLCISYQEEEKNYKLVCSFVLVVMMTLLRPYFLIFILFPGYMLFRKNKILGVAVTIITGVGATALYFVITEKFCAPYFIESIKTYWIQQYRLAGAWEGFKYMVKEVLKGIEEFGRLCIDAVHGKAWRSGMSLQFLTVLLILTIQTVVDFVKKRKKECLLHGFLSGSFMVILIALLLLYQVSAGIRHFVVLITIACFAISRMESKWFLKVIVTGLVVSVTYLQVWSGGVYCQVPFENPEVKAAVEELSLSLEQEMVLQKDGPSFDNTLIWTLDDVVEEKSVILRWQILYAIPAGYGMNCCSGGYVKNNFDTLKSRYLAVPAGGELEKRCEDSGKKELGRTEDVVVYALR